jgi:hypothetical protein
LDGDFAVLNDKSIGLTHVELGLLTDCALFDVSIPGQGTVLLDVGRVVVLRHQGITFEAGQHQEVDGDTGAFRAALA